ncbi:MAG: transmembrane anchor protein [Gemmatirosa sp.]
MPDMNPAPSNALPSSRQLVRSTTIAAATAAVLLVTAVLPAEYGVDPTGIGRVLGLTSMGEIKMELAKEAAAAEAAEAAAARATPTTTAVTAASPGTPAAPNVAAVAPTVAPPAAAADSTVKVDAIHVTMRPNESKEIKLVMRKGARVKYAWSTDRGAVSFETHGDTLNAPPGVFHSYSKGRGARAHEGAFVAVFDGQHGWFWRNRTREVVTITLRTEGEYRELKRLD